MRRATSTKTKIPWLMAAISTLAVSNHGAALQSSRECPTAGELKLGVQLLCGEEVVVGTAAQTDLSLCDADGQTGCIANESFVAVPASDLQAGDIRADTTVGGVVGTFIHEIDALGLVACIADGQFSCVVEEGFAALRTAGFTEKLLAGEIVASISGIAVKNPPPWCDAIGKTGCLAVSEYPAIEVNRLNRCTEETP